MIEFWLAAGLMCLSALWIVMMPLRHGNRAPSTGSGERTVQNVALYRERLAELEQQHRVGSLTTSSWQEAQDEAARTLLADTAQVPSDNRQGSYRLPLLAALAVPVLALVLYGHWGALDAVEQAQHSSAQPASLAQLTQQLERAVQARPTETKGWYFLGQLYLAQERPADAAKAIARAAELSGREPRLLGLWAQALYMTSGGQWTGQIDLLTTEALQADPREETSLDLRGTAAFADGRYRLAVDYWQRLLAVRSARHDTADELVNRIKLAQLRAQRER